MPLRITLIGFGAVNRAFARLLAREEQRLLDEQNLQVRYHAIIARHGSWEAAVKEGLSASQVGSLADAVASSELRLDGSNDSIPPHILEHPADVIATRTPSEEEIRKIICRTSHGLDGQACVIEAIDVDYDQGEPATSYLQEALRHGIHAVSANKGPVVHHRPDLLATAESHGVRYMHESAVMDGVPIFSTWRGGFLPGGARLQKFRGCLNSTSSVVLSGMEAGQSMEASLKVAQDAGIAEADPSGDLRGMDAAVKVVALAVAFELGREPPRPSATSGMAAASTAAATPPATLFSLSDVSVSGIEHVTPTQVAEAKAAGRKLRLVGGAEVDASSGRVSGYVRVESLAPGDPLFGLEGADAAVQLFTDRLAPVTIVQSGSVVEDTAFGQYADMLRAVRPMGV